MGMEHSQCATSVPPGIALLRSSGVHLSFGSFQVLVWVLTFIAYTLYHASRKPLSIVKGVLHPVTVPTANSTFLAADSQGWAPFDGAQGRTMLGELDFAFLACYSFGMFFLGHLADSLNLRYFLAAGMVGSGLFVCLFGMGFFWNVHQLWFYFLTHMAAGLFQSTGWPSVVAVMAHWYGKEGRGLVMGIWNAHTSVGNILGSLGSSAVLSLGWGWAFIVPGLAIFLGGGLIFLFMPAEPQDMGFESPHDTEEDEEEDKNQAATWQQGADVAALASGPGLEARHEKGQALSTSIVGKMAESEVHGLVNKAPDSHSGLEDSRDRLLASPAVGHEQGPDGRPSALSIPRKEPSSSPEDTTTTIARGSSSGGSSTSSSPKKILDDLLQDDSSALLEPLKVNRDHEVAVPAAPPADPERLETINFFQAWSIPGVAAYALCLFFAKLVAYTFLNWLPFYISHTKINGQYISDSLAGVTSTVFDLGGILGGILAGHLSDRFEASALVSALFMMAAVPALGLYYFLGHISLELNMALLALAGFFVNGPYALITCAVSADLGQHKSLKGNARALSTVTGIIDGTGSLGAGLGPFLTGFVADFLGGWEGVFFMLMAAAGAAVLCVVRLAKKEWDKLCEAKAQSPDSLLSA